MKSVMQKYSRKDNVLALKGKIPPADSNKLNRLASLKPLYPRQVSTDTFISSECTVQNVNKRFHIYLLIKKSFSLLLMVVVDQLQVHVNEEWVEKL